MQLSTPTRKRRNDGGSLLAKCTPLRDVIDCMHPQVTPLISVRYRWYRYMCYTLHVEKCESFDGDSLLRDSLFFSWSRSVLAGK